MQIRRVAPGERVTATFLKNINMVSRAAAQYLEQELFGEYGLRGYQSKYILAIYNDEGVSQDALSKRLFVNKSSVARQLAQLEEAGYVERRACPTDKRAFELRLTQKGAALVPGIRAVNEKWREVITAGFDEGEKAELLALTDRLYENAVAYMEKKS